MQKEGKRADVTLVSGSLTLLGGWVGANTSSLWFSVMRDLSVKTCER